MINSKSVTEQLEFILGELINFRTAKAKLSYKFPSVGVIDRGDYVPVKKLENGVAKNIQKLLNTIEDEVLCLSSLEETYKD